jgi:hypothetical protein
MRRGCCFNSCHIDITACLAVPPASYMFGNAATLTTVGLGRLMQFALRYDF